MWRCRLQKYEPNNLALLSILHNSACGAGKQQRVRRILCDFVTTCHKQLLSLVGTDGYIPALLPHEHFTDWSCPGKMLL